MAPRFVRRFETLAGRAWQAREVESGPGWELRHTDGMHRRLNSLTVWPEATGPLDDLVDRAEAFYGARERPSIVKLTEASHTGLDDLLAARGYAIEAPTFVQSRAINRGPTDRGLEITSDVTPVWLDTFSAIRGLSASRRSILEGILDRIDGEPGYALAHEEGEPAATGLAIVTDDHVGLFEIATDPAWRGRGLAQQIVGTLVGWGATAGATAAYLQVEVDNERALRLYRRLGFETRYRYWYRVRP